MKPKVKEILWDAFAVAFIGLGCFLHGWPSLIFLMLGSLCAPFALYFTLLNHRVHSVSKRLARSSAFGLFAVFIVGGLIYWQQWKLPEPNPYPHFVVSLHTENAPDDLVLLTNDSLKVVHWGDWDAKPQLAIGYLFVPAEASNVALAVVVRNDGPAESEDAELTFMVTKWFNTLPAFGWMKSKNESKFSYGNGTNELDSWALYLPPLLPGDSFEAPSLIVQHAPISSTPNDVQPNLGDFLIMVRAKESPAQAVKGRLVFIPFVTNALHRPFILTSEPDTNGKSLLQIDIRKVLETQK
ncbi:MAG TPA: hypothetical protein VGY56_21730 [Verrucomicrobiae bacterium]|nr:hypothetical protein [Verrucomicrobiae bacterium]